MLNILIQQIIRHFLQIEKVLQKELNALIIPALGRLLASMEKNLTKNVSDDLKPTLSQVCDNAPQSSNELFSNIPSLCLRGGGRSRKQ